MTAPFTPQSIVDQTNALARKFNDELLGIKESDLDPASWRLACIAMSELLNIDPNEAVRQLEKEKVG